MDKVTRIALLGPSLGEKGAGVQQHVKTILTAFELSQEYKLVHYSITSNIYREFMLKKIARFCIKIIAFIPFLVSNKIDIVHINSTIDNRCFLRDASYLLFSKILKKRVVFQFHGGWMKRIGLLKLPFGKTLFKYIFGLADVILFLSNKQMEKFQNIFNLSNVGKTLNFIDIESYKKTLMSEEETVKILFLGRLDKAKGILDLLNVFSLIESFDVKLVIAGEGILKDEMLEFIRQKQLKGKIDMVGYVEGKEKIQLYNQVDIFALPSWHEGFPYSVLEAMSCSLPIIATKVGALPEVIESGVNGFLVDVGDTESLLRNVQELVNNKELRKQMGLRNRSLVEENYGFTQMKEFWENIYSGSYAR